MKDRQAAGWMSFVQCEPMAGGTVMSPSWLTKMHKHTSKGAEMTRTTSDKDNSAKNVVGLTRLNTNYYCQHFSPETLSYFLKGGR